MPELYATLATAYGLGIHKRSISFLLAVSVFPTIRQGRRVKMWSTLDGSAARVYDRWSSGDNAKRCRWIPSIIRVDRQSYFLNVQ
jgi:hypothetical protein